MIQEKKRYDGYYFFPVVIITLNNNVTIINYDYYVLIMVIITIIIPRTKQVWTEKTDIMETFHSSVTARIFRLVDEVRFVLKLQTMIIVMIIKEKYGFYCNFFFNKNLHKDKNLVSHLSIPSFSMI